MKSISAQGGILFFGLAVIVEGITCQEFCVASNWGDYVEIPEEEERRLCENRRESELKANEDMRIWIQDLQLPENLFDEQRRDGICTSIKLALVEHPNSSCHVHEMISQKQVLIENESSSEDEVFKARFVVDLLGEALKYAGIEDRTRTGGASAVYMRSAGEQQDAVSNSDRNDNSYELPGWNDLIELTEEEVKELFQKAEVERNTNNRYINSVVVKLTDGRLVGFSKKKYAEFKPLKLAEEAILQLKKGEARVVGDGQYFLNVVLSSGENVFLMKNGR